MTWIVWHMYDRACNFVADMVAGPKITFGSLETQYDGLPPVPNPDAPLGTGTQAAAPQAWQAPPGGGRGQAHHTAPDCIYTDDEKHYCVNSYGDPIIPGQSCYDTARAETLRTFRDQHPSFRRLTGDPR